MNNLIKIRHVIPLHFDALLVLERNVEPRSGAE